MELKSLSVGNVESLIRAARSGTRRIKPWLEEVLCVLEIRDTASRTGVLHAGVVGRTERRVHSRPKEGRNPAFGLSLHGIQSTRSRRAKTWVGGPERLVPLAIGVSAT